MVINLDVKFFILDKINYLIYSIQRTSKQVIFIS